MSAATNSEKSPTETHSELPPLPFHARTKEQRQLRDLYKQIYDQKRAAGKAVDQQALLEAMPAGAKEKIELYAREQEQERNPVVEYESLRTKVFSGPISKSGLCANTKPGIDGNSLTVNVFA
jgi:hypothetical protein